MKRLALPLLAALTACEDGKANFARMLDQRKFEAYEANPFFADGASMRQPPPGTVPRNARLGPAELVQGITNGAYVTTLPVAVDRGLLERGRDRFRIYCAVCHGLGGDGDSEVARAMLSRRPPSLHEARIRDLPVGQTFGVVSNGYGLMPAYASALSLEERWAVVAYVKALQLSGAVPLAELSPELQREAGPWLK